MASKLFFFVIVLAIVCISSAEGQTMIPNLSPTPKLFFRPGSDSLCDIPICTSPCEGTAPPPRCPPNITQQCALSGCACMRYCDDPHYKFTQCFETKHCQERRRFVDKRRKTTRAMRRMQ